MMYLDTYESPVGTLTLASDGEHMCGLWLEGQKYFEEKLETRVNGAKAAKDEEAEQMTGEKAREASPALRAARAWLDRYFEGKDPGELPPLALHGTEFQEQVWAEIAKIPYGQLTTYGDIAKTIGPKRPTGKASARAVGVAVGRNPCSIIVPCHRVVGSTGSMTGYAGGIKRKSWLLEHEGVDMSKLTVPTRGTAL